MVDWRHYDDPNNWDADSVDENGDPVSSWLNPKLFKGTFKNQLSMDYGDDYSPADKSVMDEITRDESGPVELTDRPTSTTNVARPRTLAAGWEAYTPTESDPNPRGLGRLTVVFRDGTYWNYEDVSEGEWQNFHSSISKGKPWLKPGGTIASKENGRADVSSLPADIQAQLINYRRVQIASASQRKYRNGGKVAKFSRASNARIQKFGKKYR
jgi:hypothetical protein